MGNALSTQAYDEFAVTLLSSLSLDFTYHLSFIVSPVWTVPNTNTKTQQQRREKRTGLPCFFICLFKATGHTFEKLTIFLFGLTAKLVYSIPNGNGNVP